MRRTLTMAVIVILTAAASVPILRWMPLPFAWIGLMWGVAAFAAIPRLAVGMRTLLSTLGAVAIALAAAEVWFAYSLPREIDRQWSPPLFHVDPVLGWAPMPSQVVHAKAAVDGQMLYHVRYSIDATGHRITAPVQSATVRGCVYFFADSFTFGLGVDDSESLPYQAGALTQGRYRIINFGVPGYGAEHMLANLERGELSKSAPCEPTHIIYLALPNHILRAAGKTSFSETGPRYQLRADGTPVYVGTPAASASSAQAPAARSWWLREVVYQSTKSQILRAFAGRQPTPTSADVELYFAIVSKAYRIAADRWPSAQRHVISWDTPDQLVGQDRFHLGLAAADVQIHAIDAVIPGYSQNPAEHSLHRLDPHPNAQTYRRVAQYLAERVLIDKPTLP